MSLVAAMCESDTDTACTGLWWYHLTNCTSTSFPEPNMWNIKLPS